jgi:hypothetical protein
MDFSIASISASRSLCVPSIPTIPGIIRDQWWDIVEVAAASEHEVVRFDRLIVSKSLARKARNPE